MRLSSAHRARGRLSACRSTACGLAILGGLYLVACEASDAAGPGTSEDEVIDDAGALDWTDSVTADAAPPDTASPDAGVSEGGLSDGWIADTALPDEGASDTDTTESGFSDADADEEVDRDSGLEDGSLDVSDSSVEDGSEMPSPDAAADPPTEEVIEVGPVEAPAIQWHAGLGTGSEEHVHEGMQTRDGGYVAIGQTWEAADDPRSEPDILVIKIDGAGTQQWLRVLGTPDASDVGYAIAEVGDGFVLGVGLSTDGAQGPALIKLDEAGDLVWQQTYAVGGGGGGGGGGSGSGAIRGLEVLADGTILGTGYVGSPMEGFRFIADEAQGFLMKVSADGALLWTQTLELSQGTKVREEAEGTLAVLSTEWVFAGGEDIQNMVVHRTTAEGEPIETFHFGGSNNVQAFDFDLTTDGGFILAGHTTGYATENWDCAVARVSADGTLLWMGVFGQPRGYDPRFIHDECYGVRQVSDGGFVAVGGTGDEYPYSEAGHPSGPSDEWKAYVIRLDPDGTALYEAVYGGEPNEGHNAAEFVGLTSDEGFILFTDTDTQGVPAPNNFGFMKLGPER